MINNVAFVVEKKKFIFSDQLSLRLGRTVCAVCTDLCTAHKFSYKALIELVALRTVKCIYKI